ncbi:MAG: MSHA pilin protein MshA [Cognaticolwellia sp.]|jgi:MSHA pilin protein MshA
MINTTQCHREYLKQYAYQLKSDTINIGNGGGTSSNGELFITYGYPVANELEWQRLIDVDTEHFKYRGLNIEV